MKKYHVATGDGKAYYGVGYESYREAEGVLKISQMHDPQAHIVEEEYHFTNADRIRAMSDKELAEFLADEIPHGDCYGCDLECATFEGDKFVDCCHNAFYRWLKQPAEGE